MKHGWIGRISCVFATLLFVTGGFVVLAPPAEAAVQGRTFGLGIAVGDPTGLSLKAWTGPSTAFDLHVGYGGGWAWGRRLRVHGDHLWHHELTSSSELALDFYFGIGAKVGVYERRYRHRYDRDRDDRYRREWTGFTFGARVPLGLALVIGDAPVDVFLEVAPGVRFYDGGPGGFMDALLGVRYYFP